MTISNATRPQTKNLSMLPPNQSLKLTAEAEVVSRSPQENGEQDLDIKKSKTKNY
jgi:hypothetical protein